MSPSAVPTVIPTPVPTNTPVPVILGGLTINPNPVEHNSPATISYSLNRAANVTVLVTDKHGSPTYSASFAAGTNGGGVGNNDVAMPQGGPPGLSPYTLTVTVLGGSSRSIQFNSTP